MPDRWRDQRYLVTQQYPNGANLNARIRLHQLYSSNTYDWFLWVFDRLRLPLAARILEIGCGTGKLWVRNLHRISSEWQIDLVDLSHGMLMEAEGSLASSSLFRFTVMDAQNLKYDNGTFDTVIANHMLYHVPNLPRTLQEIQRVLAPGGKIYAATNGSDHLKEIFELAAKLPVAEEIAQLSNHQMRPIRQFSLENGAALLQPYFTDIRLELYPDSLEVTQSEPLTDYLLSLLSDLSPQPEAIAWITSIAKMAITSSPSGIFHVSKSTGLFSAIKQ